MQKQTLSDYQSTLLLQINLSTYKLAFQKIRKEPTSLFRSNQKKQKRKINIRFHVIYSDENSRILYNLKQLKQMSDQLKPEIPEPPKAKKQNSYTYWVDEKNKSRQLPPEQRPQKVQVYVQQEPSQQGPSVWNKSGTWEEKKISLSQIQASSIQIFKQLIVDHGFDGIELGAVKIQGDAYKVYKKNKWGALYQIHGSIEFKKQQKSTKIKLVQLTNMGDREYQLTGNSQLRKIIQPKADTFVKAVQSVLARHNT